MTTETKFVASDPNLKPCPHCPESIVSTCKDHGSRRWQVICGACGSATGMCATEAEAIAAWNRRAPTEIERTSKALIEAEDFARHVHKSRKPTGPNGMPMITDRYRSRVMAADRALEEARAAWRRAVKS